MIFPLDLSRIISPVPLNTGRNSLDAGPSGFRIEHIPINPAFSLSTRVDVKLARAL